MKKLLALIAMPALLGAQERVALSPADTGYRIISLEEAVRLAKINSPQAIAAKGAIRNAEGALKTTQANWWPTLSSSLGASRSGGQSRNNNTGAIESYSARPWGYSHGFSTGLTLWDGNQRVYNAAARRADIEAQETAEVTTEFSIATQVKQQYYAILAGRESESASQQQVEQARLQLAASTAKLKAGAVNISDSLRSEIALLQQQAAVANARTAVRNASANLSRLVGTSELVTANPADTIGRLRLSLNEAALIDEAMNGPAVRQAQAALAAAHSAVRAARGTLWPTVSASAGWNGNGRDQFYGLRDPFVYGYNYGLSLSFPIFDRYGRSEQINRAQVTVTNADATLRDARLLARQNAIQQLGAIRTADEQIRISEATLQAAEEDLRVQRQRYNLGSSTLLEVTTSQNAVNSARLSLIQARQQYRNAVAQLEAVLGRDIR